MTQNIEDRFRGVMPDHYGSDDWEDMDLPDEPLRTVTAKRAAWRVLHGALFALGVFTAGWAIIIAVFALLSGRGWAHEAPMGWVYSASCCSNRDCAELPEGSVKEGPDGYEITLLPGQHPMVSKPFREVVPYQSTKLRDAPDGRYHGCILPSGFVVCLYRGSRGF